MKFYKELSDPVSRRNIHASNLTWQRVDAVVKAGGWPNAAFILTWDDWGGYADHVSTPNADTAIDALHPAGFQLIGGSRIPMLMFGGQVRQGIDTLWHSHAVIPKTVVDLFGLPPFGVPRVDSSASLASRVDPTLSRPAPGAVCLRNLWRTWWRTVAQLIAAPDDAVVRAKPPKLPQGL